MAYKPTRQRQVRIRPGSIIPMSGLNALGQSFNSIADSIRSVDDEIEKNQLSTALTEAQRLGNTKGAVYEKEQDGTKTLKPFVPLTYADMADTAGLRGQSIRAAQETLNEAARTTYQSAVLNRAIKESRQSLEKNKFNPAALDEEKKSFLETIRRENAGNIDLIDEIDVELEKIFAGDRNIALGNQTKLQRDASVKEITTSLGNITETQAKIVGSGALNGPAAEKAKAEIVQLDAKREKLYSALKTYGIPQNDIEERENKHKSGVQARVSENTVQALYESEGREAAYSLIQDMGVQLRGSDDLDGEMIVTAMTARFDFLEKQASLRDSETNKRQNTNYVDASLKITLGTITDASQLPTDVDPGQRNVLLQQLANEATARGAKVEAAREERFNNLMAAYERPDFDLQGRTRAALYSEVVKLFKAKEIKYPELVKFLKLQETIMIDDMKSGSGRQMDMVLMAMDKNNPYHSPMTFVNMTEDLKNRGIIGSGDGAVMTIGDWQGRISSYREAYRKHRGQVSAQVAVTNKIDSLQPMNASDMAHLEATNQIPMTLSNGQPLDVFSEDPTTARSSADIAIAWSVHHLGMHPALESFLKGSVWAGDPTSVKRTVELHSQLQRSMMRKFNMNHMQVGRLMNEMGIDTSVLNSNTRFMSTDQIIALSNRTQTNQARLSTSIIPKEGGEPLDRPQLFKRMMSEIDNVDGELSDILLRGITHTYFPIMDVVGDDGRPVRREFIKMYEDFEADGMTMSDVIARDGRAVNLIMDLAEADVAAGKYTSDYNGLATAVSNTLVRLMDDIGLQRNVDGDVELVMHPIQKEAQKTAAGFSNVFITQDDINEDVTRIFRSIPSLVPDKRSLVSEAIAEGKYIFQPNAVFGRRPTYTVSVQTDDGQILKLLPSYSYNFQTSRQYEAYDQALEKIQNNDLKNIMASLPLLDDTVMEATYNAMNEHGRSEETFAVLKKAFNRAGYAMFDNFDPLVIGKNDAALFRNYILTLGISGAM